MRWSRRTHDARRRGTAALVLVFVLTALAPSASAQMKGMTIGSGSVGADFFAFGSAMQRVLAKAHPRLTFENTTTSGSVENIRLLNRKEVDLAIFQISESTKGAWDGTGRFQGQAPFKGIRTIASLFSFNYSLVVPKSSSIRSIEEVAGKRIVIGPDPATQDVHASPIFRAFGIDYTAMRRIYGSYSDIYRQFAEGRADAGMGYMSGVIPIAAVLELAAGTELRWLTMDPEKLKAAGIVPMTIPPGTLPHQDGPLVVAQRGLNVLAGSVELSDEQAYEVARLLHRELAFVADLVPVMRRNLAEPASLAVSSDPFPYHPGAARYWREAGFLK